MTIKRLIGSAPSQISRNKDLGGMAFQDAADVTQYNVQQTTYTTNEGPSLLLDFANAKALDSRITFTRSTTATYYNGTTSAVAEQNLFTRSQEFDSADWGKTATAVTANSTVAPDGTTTADTVTADGTTGSKTISGSNMGTVAAPATARTVSVYAKAGTNNFLQIYFSGDATPWADFDLSAGTVGSTGSNQTASIVSVGSGWYRCVLYTASTTATTCNFCIVSSSTAARAESNSLATTVILWGAQLEQRSAATAYTPTTTTAITNYIPVLQTAAINAPRFDFNPTTGESLGLLIEEQRTNLLTYSDDFSNAVWSKNQSSVVANTIIAPDGTLTGDKLVEDSSTAEHRFTQTYSATSGTSYTFSVLAKAGERTFLALSSNQPAVDYTYFNLSTGAIGTQGAGYTATMTSVGNGWYRCSITYTANSTATASVRIHVTSANGTINYTGNGYSGIYIWGAQLEAGAFATSYIPTVASQVTRSGDVAPLLTSSWLNINQGSFCVGFTPRFSTPATNNSLIGANTVNFLYVGNTDGKLYVYDGTNNTPTANIVNPNVTNKAVFNYNGNSSVTCLNGGATVSSTSIGWGTVTTLSIGNRTTSSSNQAMNGWIQKVTYYPIALTSAELQEMTS